MILRVPDSYSRALFLIASLLLAACMSFFAVRMARAARAAEGQTGGELRAAVRWEPSNPEYWYRLGHYEQFNLEEPDSRRAVTALLKAASLNPQYTDAWLDLATTYELEGRNSDAAQAYTRAQQSYPASAEVAWRYGNFLLRGGSLEQAFGELHRAIEADPKRGAAAFSRVYRADPDMDEILGKVLPKNPTVYRDVIAETTASRQLALAQVVWVRLLTMNPHLELRDFDPLVRALIDGKEYSAARRVWNQGTETMKLQPLLQPTGTVVWDPSFESGINGSAFSWSFRPLEQGVQFIFDSTEKHSGNQSLRLSFDGKQNPSLDAACTLALVNPKTTYQLLAWVKTRELTTEQGLKLRIRGANSRGEAIADTAEFHGFMPWTPVTMTWTAGGDTHYVHVCLSRDPSSDPDVRISGNAWVDDVNLVPAPSEQRNP